MVKVEEKQEEKKVSVKIVPDDFPIENYLDMEGNVVVCVKDRDVKLENYVRTIEGKEKLDEVHKILTK